MALPLGFRLGPYELVALAGAGGMGEVYRARDTRLDRTIAIKVLPAHFADDPERQGRFEREARAISMLNHPHICTLYDVGHQDGLEFLVMEYVEGETMKERLARGPFPPAQLFRHAIEIAGALDHAHRRGIVHRDLKPANVMLTPAGAKLLDFGLAKTADLKAGAAHDVDVLGRSAGSAEQNATGGPTAPHRLTAQGTILGTLHYMAPEQLEGKDADARTDIFAFGALLHEMATGRKAFDGGSPASLIAAILEREPAAVATLQPLVPAGFDRVVTRCLAKDPDNRWQSARDLWLELHWIAAASADAASVVARQTISIRAPWIAAGVCLLVAGVATIIAFIASSNRAPADVRSIRFEVSAPEGMTLSPSGSAMSLSPDGRYLAFTARSGGRSALFLRALDSLVARELPGSDGAAGPFWSADSRFIAFAAGGKLKTIGIGGGPPQSLCDAPSGSGTWNRDGIILIGSGGGSGGGSARDAGGLLRVSVAEGVPRLLTTLDQSRAETSHQWPQFLPDGRHYLFLVRSLHPEHTGIYVGSLDSAERTRLLGADSNALYAPPGQLLFRRETTLIAQPFDARTLKLSGEPIAIANSVAFSSGGGRTTVAVSETGVLAYRASVDRQLMWYDRAGRPLGVVADSGDDPALSPDNTRLAIDRLDATAGTKNIWVIDLSRGTASRLTFRRWEIAPVWSPDGSRIAFGSNRDGPMNIYQKAWTGAGDEEPVFKSATDKVPADWSRDGRFILYSGLQGDPVAPGVRSTNALWSLPLVGSRQPQRLLETPFSVATAQLSPDGRWVAYMANESGIDEVYVRSFPAGEGKWQISTRGGGEPKWRGDGRELFYLAADQRMTAVPVKTGAAFEAGLPAALFETRTSSSSGFGVLGRNQYVVTADGQRFLINQSTTTSPPITIVTNWMASLRR